jgi:hypothetical protein
MNSDCRNRSAFTAKFLAQSRISSAVRRATDGEQTELERGVKNFLGCPLQRCQSNFCVAVILLQINLCTRSHHL